MTITFTPKNWEDDPDTDTPISAAALEDLEQRVADFAKAYADSVVTLSAKSFGAIGNGSTNDTTAIQNAINAASAAGGGVVYLPAGTYRVATTLLGASKVSLVGDGMGATVLLFDDVTGDGITYQGTAATAIALSANMAEYATTATLASGGVGFSAGDLVYFTCSASVNWGKWVTRVLSVAGNVLTLQEPCPGSFLTANGAQAQRLSTVLRGFRISDLTIKCTAESPANRTVLARLSCTEDAAIERVRFENSKNVAVVTGAGRNLSIRDCVFADMLQADTSLDVLIDGVTAALFTGNETHNCSCGVVLDGSPRSVVSNNRLNGHATLGGRGVKLLARSNYSRVTGNVISNFEATHTAVHITDSWGCGVNFNEFDNCGPINLASAIGSGNDVHHNDISHNTLRNILGTQAAIVVTSGANAVPTYNTIIGNTIDGCRRDGIGLQTNRNIVSGNVITNYGSDGNYGGVSTLSDCSSNQIENNTIVSAAGGKKALKNYGVGRNFWRKNYFPTDETELIAGDVFESVDPFPLTYVSDRFDRVDEGPPPSADWTTPIFSGESGLKVVSRRLASTPSTWSSSWWNANSYTDDVEIWAQIITYARFYLYVHMANEGAGTLRGYCLQCTGTTMYVQRVDAAVETNLASNTSVPIAAGDSVGLRILRTELQAWYQPRGKTWRPVTPIVTSATYTSGHVGVEMSSSNPVLDNIGFG